MAVSLFIGIMAPFFYVVIGIANGSTAGFMGGSNGSGADTLHRLVVAGSRLVRGQILHIREEGYVGGSRLLGAKTS